MKKQFDWPDPNDPAMAITDTPQVTPLSIAKAFPGILFLVSIFPTNFSVAPAPTSLTIREWMDEGATELAWEFTWPPPPLTSGEWCSSDLVPADGKGPLAAFARYYQIFTNQGTLDLRVKALYTDTIGQTSVSFDFLNPI